ncbi:MAG: ATP-binding protein [Gemmataceae bacterium]|nr:ATP-binding protein [Gemmataceae bacterium]
MQNGRLELSIASDLEQVPRIQDEITDHLRSHQFGDRDIFGIRLALEEALVNAIKHGNREDRGKKVHVQVLMHHDRVDILVADEGPGFNPSQVANPLADENLERASGRGLLLMRHYMSDVTYHPPGNRVTMSKARPGANGKK